MDTVIRENRLTLNSDIFDTHVVIADTGTYSLTNPLQIPLSTKCKAPQLSSCCVCQYTYTDSLTHLLQIPLSTKCKAPQLLVSLV